MAGVNDDKTLKEYLLTVFCRTLNGIVDNL